MYKKIVKQEQTSEGRQQFLNKIGFVDNQAKNCGFQIPHNLQ